MADSQSGDAKAVPSKTAPAASSSSKTQPASGPSDAAGPEIANGILLPPLPTTASPIEFKQQINVYQIPQSAWDRLNQEQTMELTRVILERADAIDQRHFEYAKEKAKDNREGKKLAIMVGAAITVVGYGIAALLSFYGHEMAAITVSLPITTILAIVIGNRFLD
jgi:hypothetical protein